MASERVDAFIDALHRLEDGRELEPIVSLFAPDAELRNPLHHRLHCGRAEVQEFWETYRRTFRVLHSDFRRVIEGNGIAALEWTTRGEAVDGHAFSYDGVSVLEFRDRTVGRFRAYFDTRRLAEQVGGLR
ncbi:MAG TPA: nuclear transport factor 2 family protein [Longimicrobiales bacterium]